MADVVEKVLEGVEYLVDKKVSEAGFNKTIKATIIKCENEALGKYKVRYQDKEFSAYAQDPSSDIFKPEIMVFVLLPNGNWDDTKTIISSVDKTLNDYEADLESQDIYNMKGSNVIQGGVYSLCSFKNNSIILYSEEKKEEGFIFFEDLFNKYLDDEHDYLVLRTEIKTDIDKRRESGSDFGVSLKVQYKDGLIKEYTLAANDMVGQPFQSYTYSTQRKLIENVTDIEKIVEIKLFAKDFPTDGLVDAHDDDIFFRNLELFFAEKVPLSDTAGYGLFIKTPNGDHFGDYNNKKDIIFEASLKYNGKMLATSSAIEYYWFVKDATVNSKSPRYNVHGGNGWRCLNEFEIYENALEWIPSQSVFSLPLSSQRVNEQYYKCVAVYDGNSAEKTVRIVNDNADIEMNITSSKGIKFYFSQGDTDLTCEVKSPFKEEELVYSWGYYDNMGVFNEIGDIKEIIQEKLETSEDVHYILLRKKNKLWECLGNFKTYRNALDYRHLLPVDTSAIYRIAPTNTRFEIGVFVDAYFNIVTDTSQETELALVNNNEKMSADLVTLEDKTKRELQKDIKNIDDKVQTLDVKIQDLNAEKAHLQQTPTTDNKKRIDEINKQIDTLKQEKLNLNKTITSIEEQIDKLQQETAKNQIEIGETNQLIGYINTAMLELDEKIAELKRLQEEKASAEEIEKQKKEIDSKRVDVQESISLLEEKENEIRDFLTIPNDGPTINVKAVDIIEFSNYICSVYYDEEFLGTAEIRLENSLEEEDVLYTLVLKNGKQLFKYDLAGNSPTSSRVMKPIVIPQLEFDIYNKEGKLIDEEVKKSLVPVWTFPEETVYFRTMLTTNEEPDEEGGHIYSDKDTFTYNLKPIYDAFGLNNNTIRLDVECDGVALSAVTDFTFLKEGDPGTSGSNISVNIEPIGTKREYRTKGILEYPMVICEVDEKWETITGIIGTNFADLSSSNWFKVTAYEGSTDLSGYITNVSWDIMSNTYYSKSKNLYSISNSKEINGGKLMLNRKYLFEKDKNGEYKELDFDFSSIITASFDYSERRFVASLPIVTMFVHKDYKDVDFYINKSDGFSFVTYNNDGCNPAYNKYAPFRVSGNVMPDAKWYPVKSTKVYANIEEADFKITNNEDGSCLAVPPQRYNGARLGCGLYAYVYGKDTIGEGDRQAIIHVPVHLLHNRYSNGAINEWDGNSIGTSSDGSTLLAPQIVAGEKDKDNKFTGVAMGKIIGYHDIEGKAEEYTESGLMGYSSGDRSFFLDAKTGNATFGVADKGQIEIKPNQMVIKSGGYNDKNGYGMKIDMGNQDPSIKFRSQKNQGMFTVDSEKLYLGNISRTKYFEVDTKNGTATFKGGIFEAGTIEANTQITSPVINGGTITGTEITAKTLKSTGKSSSDNIDRTVFIKDGQIHFLKQNNYYGLIKNDQYVYYDSDKKSRNTITIEGNDIVITNPDDGNTYREKQPNIFLSEHTTTIPRLQTSYGNHSGWICVSGAKIQSKIDTIYVGSTSIRGTGGTSAPLIHSKQLHDICSSMNGSLNRVIFANNATNSTSQVHIEGVTWVPGADSYYVVFDRSVPQTETIKISYVVINKSWEESA